MLALSPDGNVRTYFEGVTKGMHDAIRHVVLEDINKLLEGERGEYLEHRRDIGDHFLEICDNYGVHLSFSIHRR